MDEELKKYILVEIVEARPSKMYVVKTNSNEHVNPAYFSDNIGYTVYGGWNTGRLVPSSIFEKAYRPIEGLTFGLAVEALKKGCTSIARLTMDYRISLKKGSVDGSILGFKPEDIIKNGHPSTIEGISIGMFDNGDIGTICRMPSFQMFNANGNIVDGWLPSIIDILADDWMIIE